MTLKSATARLKAYAGLVNDGRLKPAALRHARQQQMTEQEIMAAVARARARRAALEIQSAPAKYRRPAEEPAYANEPTPEWRAKVTGHVETRRAGTDIREKGYRVRHVVEQHADKFSPEMRAAIETFMQDSQHHEHVNVADWDRSGGGSPGSKLGGLGAVPQSVREAHARYMWIDKCLPNGSRRVASYLILRVMSKADGTPFSLNDFGRTMFPSIKDANSLKWAAAGAVWSLGEYLEFLYENPNCPKVSRMSDEEREAEWEQRQHPAATSFG